ncbi:class I SAM-dependent methyltransferase [Actinocorallia longicatena]|uniref:Class I SAM-dependent methyltransferase n=1 Tax=Actinocorallia longicatena TaxID=111803 RepID=A0ABP6QED5_9ACTN
MDNPLFARFLDRYGRRTERWGNGPLRAELVAGLRGRVLEIGPGTGLNFPHYPAEVTLLTGAEPEPYLRERAGAAAREAAVPVELVEAEAGDLPQEDGVFDAVVVAGVLCSVPDQARALAEIHRVLRPGGELRFYEHVRSRSVSFARWQALAAPGWARMMGGCRPDRDTLGAIRSAGFEVGRVRGLVYPHWAGVSVVAPRVHGTAVRV